MTENSKLEDDLSYIRAAVERQKRFMYEKVPLWLPVAVGLYLMALSGIIDFKVRGVISEQAKDTIAMGIHVIGIAVMAIYLFGVAKVRKFDQEKCSGANEKKTLFAIVAPFAIMVLGLVAITFLAPALGLEGRDLKAMSLLYMGLSLALIGVGRLQILFVWGVFQALGAVYYILLPDLWSNVVLGVAMAMGLSVGALLDKRRAG